jgi:NitT/TauT family transport system ATP-binding protein
MLGSVEPAIAPDPSRSVPPSGEPHPGGTAAARPSGRTTSDPAIEIRGVTKHYGPAGNSVLALDGISLTVERGEFLCMVGASGCGKTTLLNLIAGLDRPGAGTITLDAGRPALMFQEAALFPWLTAAENIELPLRFHGVPKGERQATIAALLELVHLDGFGDKRPHELSGGMRQRVALARALAQRAEVVLMDDSIRITRRDDP